MAFIHGFILALGLILPLGPQNAFIFNQGALQPKLHKSLPAVITAGLCDAALILMAVSGVSLVILKFSTVKYILLAVGVVFLIYMGKLTWQSSGKTTNPTSKFTAKRQVVFATSVSLLNPHAILDTIGVIGINSLQYSGTDKIIFTAATMIVSFAWFLLLAFAGRLIGKMGEKTVVIFNRIAAVIMWGSALYLSFTFLY